MRSLFRLLNIFISISCLGQAPENYFQFANSALDEQHPVISPDGKSLFFTIGNHPQNVGGKKDPGDIWVSNWDGKQWSSPVHAGTTLNDRAYNAVAGVSKDGQLLFLHGHYDPSGAVARTQGISVATKSPSGWSQPKNIVIPYFLNKSRIISGNVTEDGTVFVFSAEGYGGYGVDDLFVSQLVDGKWTEAQNLGAGVNTQFQELSPWLSPDKTTLYFSSNGLKGKGSFDIYYVKRLDDTWLTWSAPANVESINTTGRELYYRESSNIGYAYYTSTNSSDDYGDIKMFRSPVLFPSDSNVAANLTADPAKPETVVTDTMKHDVVPMKPAVEERSTVRVFGKVINSKTGELVKASIFFAGPSMQQSAQLLDSGYTATINRDGAYSINIESAGFISALQKVDMSGYQNPELEMNFSLQPVEVGTRVELRNVLFAQTKSEILPESFPELNMVVNFLKSNPTVKIELSGHTDNRGIHSDNVKLSQMRVNKVKEYLVEKGIDPKRITGKGYGGTRPIASNDTEESRRMNRRVEFTIKKS